VAVAEVRKHADQIAVWLQELGYTHCFFVAGGNIMHLLDAVRQRMVCIPVVHEVSAGIAAEYFNESAAPSKAFALVTAGPGVSNIVTALGGAWLESRELLVLAGQAKSSDLASGGIRQRGIQEIDGIGLTQAVTKTSLQVREPISKAEFVSAVLNGTASRPGPVFIEFCLDAQGAAPIETRDTLVHRDANPTIKDDILVDVINRLNSSRRPILLIGGGVSRDVARDLHSLIDDKQIPVMTTWNGADRVDSRLFSFLGRPNTWGQRHANLLLAQSDLIIAVGTRLGLQQTGFNWSEFGRNAYVVHVDIDESELTKGHPRTDLKLRVDANDFLARVVREVSGSWKDWLDYADKVKRALPLNDPANSSEPGFVNPYEFFSHLSEMTVADDLIIPCSSGGANSTAMQSFEQKHGQIIITNKGLASMGYGLAGAIGVSLAHPGRRTILIEGDGGFAQNLQDLATVRVNNLPIKIFIFANNGYASIRTTQRNYFNGAYLGCDTSTGLGFPDWELLFSSFGISSTTLDSDWASSHEVADQMKNAEPHCFIVPIDPLQTYWPKITSRITDTGSMESNPLHLMSPDLDDELFRSVTRYLDV
jgi:acetolactate synthase-1/2/3 large subunit